jgi:tetratricopeptide (TPR) repeat protein
VARQERNRAQRQFNAVRSLSASVLGELHDAVSPLPGSLLARELLVRRATDYLDSLAADTGEDASLRQELALGYKRLGQLQGLDGLPNLGDRAAARRSFERAAALFESFDLPAMDVNARVGAIDAYLGLALSDADKTSRTIPLSKARALLERLSREAPSDLRVLMAAMVVWFHIGNDQESSKDYDAALQSFTNEARAAESWLALRPDSGDASRNLSLAYKKMATQHELQGDADAAIALYTKALELDRARVDREPTRGIWRLDLSFSHGEVGSSLLNKGRPAEALEHQRQAIELRRAVVAGSPDDDFAQTSLARGYESLAVTLSRLGHVDAAIQADLDGISVLDRRRTAHPDRDHGWREQTAAMMAAATFCLDLLDRTRGPARSARARRVRGILERVSRLQAEWAREKRSRELPPTKPELERALQRSDRLIG